MDAQEYAMSGSETRDQQEAESAAEDAARWTCQVCGGVRGQNISARPPSPMWGMP